MAKYLRRRADVGEIVHFVLPEGPRRGECRPAMLIREQDPENGILVLSIFTDGLADDPRFSAAPSRTVVNHGGDAQPGTWHHRDECRNVTASSVKDRGGTQASTSHG